MDDVLARCQSNLNPPVSRVCSEMLYQLMSGAFPRQCYPVVEGVESFSLRLELGAKKVENVYPSPVKGCGDGFRLGSKS